jgi:hypothetical protein
MPDIVACRACGAAIFFATTDAGRAIPLDAAPVASGTIVLAPVSDHVVFLRKGSLVFPRDTPRYQSHFASCPSADRFRPKRSRHDHA